MKPKNFPARKLLRRANAQGIRLGSVAIEAARGQRSKKTPRVLWSPERNMRRRGKVT